MSYSPLGRPIRVGVFEHDPDAFNCFRNVPGGPCERPGAEIDIIKMVMQILDWKWEIVDTQAQYGVVNDFGNLKKDGNFSGIMGLLANDLVDMGGLSMRITPERMKAAHFTFPIRYFQQVYIIRKPSENDFRNFIFTPFTIQLWLLLFAFIIAVAIARSFCGIVLLGNKNKLDIIATSFLETYGMMLKQRLPNPSAVTLMILEAFTLCTMLVLRGNYQSVMNSKLTAPPTSAIPFRHQSQLLDLFEKKQRYPTYYVDFGLEGSNIENQRRIDEILKYNPIVTHDKEQDLIIEMQCVFSKGGVFYSTYDMDFLPDPISVWDKKEGLTVIRDTTGIVSYVAFGFSISNRKLCNLFNDALLKILPGIPHITLGPGYATKKDALDTSIQVKKTQLSFRKHLEQLFLIHVILTGICILVFVMELVLNRVNIYRKTELYEVDTASTIIDLQLFRTTEHP